jgi:hypothetical protein
LGVVETLRMWSSLTRACVQQLYELSPTKWTNSFL